MEEIRSRGLLDDRDVVLYDVLGTWSAAGSACRCVEQVADEVYLVTTSDFMALYAANNICRVSAIPMAVESDWAGIILQRPQQRGQRQPAPGLCRGAGNHGGGENSMSLLIRPAELGALMAVTA